MNIFDWLAEKLGTKSVPVSGDALCAALEELRSDLSVREMAFWTAVNLIGNAVSKCEFKTFDGGKEVKGPEYYLWNIQPNKNQNSSAFLHKLIAQLYSRNECLVIEQSGQLLVADSFQRKEYALYENTYSGVTVGDFNFSKTFYEGDVLYFKLSEQDMRQIVDAMYSSYARLLAYGMNAYQRSRGSKATLNYESLPTHVKLDEANQWLQGQIEKYRGFLSGDNGIATVGKGLKLEAFGRSTTYSNESTRDIRAMVDDISDFTAKAFGIPPALIRGDVEGISNALDQFLTFCVDPLCDMLQEEIIRKRIGQAAYIDGTRLYIDTRAVKHIDLLNVHGAVEKLVGSGVYCINDIRAILGEPIIDEPWAWRHFMTKNYSEIEKLLEAMEGGE